MDAYNVLFCNKVKVLLDLDKSPYFRIKDIMRVFGHLQPISNSPNVKHKRITVPLKYKVKCTQLNVKGTDFYVNVRGLRRIFLKLKIETNEELEEFFFETCVKIKLNMTENLEPIYSMINMDENSILDYEDAIAEEKLEKKRKPKGAKSKPVVKKQEPKESPKKKAEKPNAKGKVTVPELNDEEPEPVEPVKEKHEDEPEPDHEPEPEIDTEDDRDDDNEEPEESEEPEEEPEKAKEPEPLFMLLEKRKNVYYVRKTNVDKKKKIIENNIPILYETKNDLTLFTKKVVKNLSKHGDKVVCEFDESTYTIKIRSPLTSDKLIKEFIHYDTKKK